MMTALVAAAALWVSEHHEVEERSDDPYRTEGEGAGDEADQTDHQQSRQAPGHLVIDPSLEGLLPARHSQAEPPREGIEKTDLRIGGPLDQQVPLADLPPGVHRWCVTGRHVDPAFRSKRRGLVYVEVELEV